MRIVFCDDDNDFLDKLCSLVKEFFRNMGSFQPEFALYKSGEDLLEKERAADIAFLDVEMTGISGIHAGARLKEINPDIKIFIVTSYPDYLDEAMQFQVFRYLSKPIDKNRLFKNLKDAVYQYNMETKEYAITTSDGIHMKRSDEIVCIEASQRKVYVYTTDEIFVSTQRIDFWQKELSLPCFYSPHRSFIINMKYVKTVTKDQIILKYGNETKIAYLTRRKYSRFKDTYLMYRESVK